MIFHSCIDIYLLTRKMFGIFCYIKKQLYSDRYGTIPLSNIPVYILYIFLRLFLMYMYVHIDKYMHITFICNISIYLGPNQRKNS